MSKGGRKWKLRKPAAQREGGETGNKDTLLWEKGTGTLKNNHEELKGPNEGGNGKSFGAEG